MNQIPDKHWDRLLAHEQKAQLTTEQIRGRFNGIIILSEEQQEQATTMRETGASMRKISQTLHVSSTTISNFLNKKKGYAESE